MNQKPLSAAYEHMTNHQLAAAAYAHLGDELETLRIKAVIPEKTYSMLDAQFVSTLNRIIIAIEVWVGEYWRLEYLSAVNVLRMAYVHIQGELTNEGKYAESIISSKQVLAAHFEALKEVCGVHGIDYKTILKRNQIAEDVDSAVGVDLEHKATLVAALEALLVSE